jgi:hypothetical protein
MMQPIPYNVRSSSFAPRIEQAVRQAGSLSRPVRIELGPGGYEREARIDIRADDRHHFHTDWTGKDPSRFSARLRAAATVLRDLGLTGRYHASHLKGVLTLHRI